MSWKFYTYRLPETYVNVKLKDFSVTFKVLFVEIEEFRTGIF